MRWFGRGAMPRRSDADPSGSVSSRLDGIVNFPVAAGARQMIWALSDPSAVSRVGDRVTVATSVSVYPVGSQVTSWSLSAIDGGQAIPIGPVDHRRQHEIRLNGPIVVPPGPSMRQGPGTKNGGSESGVPKGSTLVKTPLSRGSAALRPGPVSVNESPASTSPPKNAKTAIEDWTGEWHPK